MITKSERAELRSLVRNQFKVLRAEVVQRQAEVLADLHAEIGTHFDGQDAQWATAHETGMRAAEAAQAKISEAFRAAFGDKYAEIPHVGIHWPARPSQSQEMYRLRAAGQTRITAQVKGALLRLDRQEADLLSQLAVGVLESDEARAFLAQIPTVGELVPAARLAELEASFTAERPDDD